MKMNKKKLSTLLLVFSVLASIGLAKWLSSFTTSNAIKLSSEKPINFQEVWLVNELNSTDAAINQEVGLIQIDNKNGDVDLSLGATMTATATNSSCQEIETDCNLLCVFDNNNIDCESNITSSKHELEQLNFNLSCIKNSCPSSIDVNVSIVEI